MSVKINNCLKLEREHRKNLSGSDFLTEIETEYRQLFTDSLISNQTINDKLIGEIPVKRPNPILLEAGL